MAGSEGVKGLRGRAVSLFQTQFGPRLCGPHPAASETPPGPLGRAETELFLLTPSKVTGTHPPPGPPDVVGVCSGGEARSGPSWALPPGPGVLGEATVPRLLLHRAEQRSRPHTPHNGASGTVWPRLACELAH